MREFMADDEGKLGVGARQPQYARMDYDFIAVSKRVRTGIGYQFDRNGAGLYRSHRVHVIGAVTANQNLNRPLTIVAHKAADPSGRIVARDRFIVECQEVVARFDSGGGSGRSIGNRQHGRLRPTHR